MSLNHYMDPEDDDRSATANYVNDDEIGAGGTSSSLSRPLLLDDERRAPSSSSSFNDGVGSLGLVSESDGRGGGEMDGDDEDDEDGSLSSHRRGRGRGGRGVGGIPTIVVIVATLAFFIVLLFLSAALVPKSSRGGTNDMTMSSRIVAHDHSPTGIHLGLTGRGHAEMYVQYSTMTPGVPVVEYAAREETAAAIAEAVDATMGGDDGHASSTTTTGDGRSIVVDGHSVTYDPSDMCQEPATTSIDEEDGDGHSRYHHTVRLTNLDADTTYEYRVGIAGGQGVEWGGGRYEFRTASSGSSTDGGGSGGGARPVTTFLALADMGCWGTPSSSSSIHRQGMGVVSYVDDDGGGDDDDYDARGGGATHVTVVRHDGEKGGNSGRVADLISSIVDESTIDSIHMFGDLSYADGIGRVWDEWFDMIQPFASRVPVMVGVGNHEYDHTSGGGGGRDPSGISTDYGFSPSWGGGSFGNVGGECGVPISRRFSVPDNGNGVFWCAWLHCSKGDPCSCRDVFAFA
jgi:hypothetical protein